MVFENIFSKFRRKKSGKAGSKELRIIADYREKNSLVISNLVERDIKVTFENLHVGDFLIGDIIIERKTVRDFVSSMINKRLLYQLRGLGKHKKRILIIEGVKEEELYSDNNIADKVGIHPNAIRGFLLSIILDCQVPIIMTNNSEDTARFLEVLAKRAIKAKTPLSLRQSRSDLSTKEQLSYILEGFPNIGPTKAKKLFEEFTTLKNIFSASEDELKKTLGKRASEFKEIIERKY